MILFVCDVPDVLKVLRLVKIAIIILKIAVPIMLIISCMIDYMKVVGDNSQLPDVNKAIVSKVIAAIVVFLIPTFVSILFNIVDPNGKTYIGCLNLATSEKINSLYNENINNLMNKARTNRDLDSYNDALNYLTNIKDKDLVRRYQKELASIKKEIDKKSEQKSNDKKPSSSLGNKYNLSDSDIEYLTMVCVREQGTIDGIKAEATLIANRYEQHKDKFSSPVDYVKNSGWFGSSGVNINVTEEQKNTVKSVFIDGYRKFPAYVDEHDCFDCNKSKYCDNGNKGDICYIVTDGKTYSSMSDIKNHSNYIKNKTVIHNVYGSVYTFEEFPCDRCDPFGYTASSYNKYK